MNNALFDGLTVAVWGGSWFGIKLQLGRVAPESSVVYRFALAALIRFAWRRFRDLSLRFTAREHGFAWGWPAALGVALALAGNLIVPGRARPPDHGPFTR